MAFALPEISASTQAFARAAYGVLLVATLVWTLPNARRFFVSERWGGYAEASWQDALHSPALYPLVLVMWIACGLLLVVGRAVVAAAVVNLILCRHYFIGLRWRSVTRGMGAPGFISYWLGAAILLLEATARLAPAAHGVALFTLQTDLAIIMLSAGLYKATAGYLQNDGMELGLANPAWGYWWRWYASLRPSHWLIWTLNQLAWTTEVIAAALMLAPPTRTWGGLLLVAVFIFIATQIRLAFLCEMVMVCGLLAVAPGTAADGLMASAVVRLGIPLSPAAGPPVAWLETVLIIGLWAYVAILPFAHAALFYNFYAGRPLPQPLQRALERYTNFFGIIIWRVFSADLINFLIRIYRQDRQSGARTLLSRYGQLTDTRFSHVGESIAVTCVFTTLKYYASNVARFEERLRRYARTLDAGAGDVIIFEYVSLLKGPDRFAEATAAEYAVDLRDGSIARDVLRPDLSPHAAHDGSPLHEGATPGSYVPLAAARRHAPVAGGHS